VTLGDEMRGTPPTAAQIREAVALVAEGDLLLRLLGIDPTTPVDLSGIIARGEAALAACSTLRHAAHRMGDRAGFPGCAARRSRSLTFSSPPPPPATTSPAADPIRPTYACLPFAVSFQERPRYRLRHRTSITVK